MLLIAGGGAPSHFHCWLEGGPFILPLLAIGGWSPFILPFLAVGGGWGGGSGDKKEALRS